MFTSEVRDRIAELLYGDGNEVSWAWSVAKADVVMWELILEDF